MTSLLTGASNIIQCPDVFNAHALPTLLTPGCTRSAGTVMGLLWPGGAATSRAAHRAYL